MTYYNRFYVNNFNLTIRRRYLKRRLQVFSKASVSLKKPNKCIAGLCNVSSQCADYRSQHGSLLIHVALVQQNELLHAVTCKSRSVHICCVQQRYDLAWFMAVVQIH